MCLSLWVTGDLRASHITSPQSVCFKNSVVDSWSIGIHNWTLCYDDLGELDGTLMSDDGSAVNTNAANNMWLPFFMVITWSFNIVMSCLSMKHGPSKSHVSTFRRIDNRRSFFYSDSILVFGLAKIQNGLWLLWITGKTCSNWGVIRHTRHKQCQKTSVSLNRNRTLW